MLKSELVKDYDKLGIELRDLKVDCRELTKERDLHDDVSRQALRKLADIKKIVEAVVAMKYPSAELSSNIFYPNNQEEAENYQAMLNVQPEELCLLRHLYSLAQ